MFQESRPAGIEGDATNETDIVKLRIGLLRVYFRIAGKGKPVDRAACFSEIIQVFPLGDEDVIEAARPLQMKGQIQMAVDEIARPGATEGVQPPRIMTAYGLYPEIKIGMTGRIDLRQDFGHIRLEGRGDILFRDRQLHVLKLPFLDEFRRKNRSYGSSRADAPQRPFKIDGGGYRIGYVCQPYFI